MKTYLKDYATTADKYSVIQFPRHMLSEGWQLQFPFFNNAFWFQFSLELSKVNSKEFKDFQLPNQREQIKDEGIRQKKVCVRYYTVIFVSYLRNQTYLVEHEGDEALFEDQGQVGPFVPTASLNFCVLWLNNEGPIDLKYKDQAVSYHNVPEGTMAELWFFRVNNMVT